MSHMLNICIHRNVRYIRYIKSNIQYANYTNYCILTVLVSNILLTIKQSLIITQDKCGLT